MSRGLWICANDAVGKKLPEHLTKEKVDAIIEECRRVRQLIIKNKN
jgi:hypothetical protein